MKIKSRKIEDVIMIEPLDKFLTGDDIKELEDTFAEAYSSGINKVIIDFSRTELIYSAFISVLLEYSQKFKSRGGKIVLANPGIEVQKIMEVTRLYQIFETYPNADEALERFKKGK